MGTPNPTFQPTNLLLDGLGWEHHHIKCFVPSPGTKMEISTTTGSGGTTCTLLDKPVGFRCLASLLGVGSSRLEKKASAAPDLRYGKREHWSKPGSWTVDGFLQVAYDAIAETLPDEHLELFQHSN